MKKIITVFFIGTVIASSIVINASAQSLAAVSAIQHNPALISYLNGNASAEKNLSTSPAEDLKAAKKELEASKENMKAMKASFRAAKDFKKSFKDAPEPAWSTEDKAIVATFIRDDIRTNVIYNKRGFLVHSLTYFTPEKTPSNIVKTIEDVYPNADIDLAVQVEEDGLEFYIVSLHDKKTIKTVSVYDGAVNLINKFQRAN